VLPQNVLFVYPPPWKLPRPGEALDPVHGPPSLAAVHELDADFFQIPYGLLSLAAQAKRAGHRVEVANLSNFPWAEVEAVLAGARADVVGFSCWTANRHGVALSAETVKRYHPETHVVVGGPHATALPNAMMRHTPSIDTLVVGEGEGTFLELLERLERRQSLVGLPGAVTREAGRLSLGPRRPPLARLDALASVHREFPTHIVMTSRGCPWSCTFCGADNSWGRGVRSLSVERVLDDIEQALARTRVRMLLFKDDTFTTNRRRVLELCQKLRERGLNFLWSCDTRVDVLDPELLFEMRRAGCERLSLGVESGSPQILSAINKKITVADIERTRAAAAEVGLAVRFYMMIGNRGETRQTFEESLAFLDRVRPDQAIFSCLSIYPGTADFRDAVAAGWLDEEVYFRERFLELKVPFGASREDTEFFDAWFREHRGVLHLGSPSVKELGAIAARFSHSHGPSLFQLASAQLGEGELAGAEHNLALAEQAGYPLPGLLENARAVLAARRSDQEGVKNHLVRAARLEPDHFTLLKNAARAKRVFESGGTLPFDLELERDFSLFERNLQPVLPGPLPAGFPSFRDESPTAHE